MQITVTEWKKGSKEMIIKPVYWDIACKLASDNAISIVDSLVKIHSLEEQLWSYAGRVITAEVKGLCSTANPSILRKTNKDSLQKLSWSLLKAEFETRAPHFLYLLKTAGYDQYRIKQYLHKSEATVLPGVLSAGCKLIAVRNREMNALRRVVSIILHKGGLKKYAFKILSATCDCVSYPLTISMLDKFGVNFDEKLLSWQKQVENDTRYEQHIQNQISKYRNNTDHNSGLIVGTLQQDLNRHISLMHPGYSFTSDNVDLQINVRHMTQSRQHKDYHLFNMLAYKNRVSGNELPDDTPTRNVIEMPLAAFLPDGQDNKHYLDEFIHLVAWVWVKHIPALKWWKDYLLPHIPHEHEKEMKTVTERVNMHMISLHNYI